jgi:hypothetical protein
MCLITIALHRPLECWIWTLYFPHNSRTFTVNFYSSDLYKLPEEIFKEDDFGGDGAPLRMWRLLIEISNFKSNVSGDIMFAVANYRTPIRELIFENYIYSE